MDNWTNKKFYTCEFCMHYSNTRCKRHAPTLQGFPAVYRTDTCGDHKLSKDTVNQIEVERFREQEEMKTRIEQGYKNAIEKCLCEEKNKQQEAKRPRGRPKKIK